MRHYVRFEQEQTPALASEWVEIEVALASYYKFSRAVDNGLHQAERLKIEGTLFDLKERLQSELRERYLSENGFTIDTETETGGEELFELHHSDELEAWIRRKDANNR